MLLEPTRELLIATGLPWVIENVADAPLGISYNAVELCGWTFGLPLYRHRRFESNVFLMQPPHRKHAAILKAGKLLGDRYGASDGVMGVFGTTEGVPRSFGTLVVTDVKPHVREAMGIDWMTNKELTQAIPPLFTEFIGRQLLDFLAVAPPEGPQ